MDTRKKIGDRLFITGLCAALWFAPDATRAQNRDYFDYNFYGFVRGDLYYNSRSNVEAVDGLFYLYPQDVALDADGKDLNAVSNGSFYTFTTRLGMNIKGPNVGSARSSANIESDFGGTTNMTFMLRLRRAYVKFDWNDGYTVLLGQTWHPLFGDVVPNILNLSTGSPFQPFNRSPQIRYQYENKGLKLTAAAIYQLVYTSVGPDGRSEKYLKDGVIPEIYVGADSKQGRLLLGAGIDVLSLKPRQRSVVSGKTYSVNERVTSFSCDLHASYNALNWQLSGKTMIAANQTHNLMLGGYGVSAIDERTGEYSYTPFRHASTWLNFVHGKKYQTCIFAGYIKNLGSIEPLDDHLKIYGTGLDVDQLTNVSVGWRYVVDHWNIGFEYTLATAWYDDDMRRSGLSVATHPVTNHRLESVFVYTF